VLWGGFWDYILIVRNGGYRFGRGDYGEDLVGDYGCAINGFIFVGFANGRTALHLSLPPFLPTGTWHIPAVTEEDFPEGEEDDDDEEGSVVVTEGREGFVSGLELARILGDILERYPFLG
jgi:hypothetical protein